VTVRSGSIILGSELMRAVCFGLQLFVCDMIHLLTATGLTPGGSSTVHICTQTVHRTQ